MDAQIRSIIESKLIILNEKQALIDEFEEIIKESFRQSFQNVQVQVESKKS